MNTLKLLALPVLAAASVGAGALAAAPSASAVPIAPGEQTASCRLVTSLGVMNYDHGSIITVISIVDHKQHKYLGYNGRWLEVKTLAAPTATYRGTFSTVLTRV